MNCYPSICNVCVRVNEHKKQLTTTIEREKKIMKKIEYRKLQAHSGSILDP